MTFSEILKHIRTKQELYARATCQRINVSFSTINRWENGHTAPSNLAKMRLLEYCQKNCVNNEIIIEISNF